MTIESGAEASGDQSGASGGQPSSGDGSAPDNGKSGGGADGQAGSSGAFEAGGESGKPQGGALESGAGDDGNGNDDAGGFDPDDLAWAEKVGLNPKEPDFPQKLVKSYREAQKNMSKAQESAAREKRAREALEKIRGISKNDSREKSEIPEGPLAEFESVHEFRVREALENHGVESLEALREANPRAYVRLRDNYVMERQKAFERNVEWSQERERERLRVEDQKREFQEELRNARTASDRNLNEIRREYPDVDKHFNSAGVESFLKHIEKSASWPREYILQNAPVAKWLAKAARAIDMLENLPKKEAEWMQKYEEKLAKAKQVELPSGEQGPDSAKIKAGMVRGDGKRPGTGVSILN